MAAARHGLVLLAWLCWVPLAGAQVIISDDFDDGNIDTNTTGTGTGWTTAYASTAPPIEASGLWTAPASVLTTGNAIDAINSKDSFAINGSQTVTASFTITEMVRTQSIDGQTTRFFVGLTPAAPGGNIVEEGQTEGLWVILHGRYQTQLDLVNAGMVAGSGGLVHIVGTTVTVLETWMWDATALTFDFASGLAGHRMAMSLVPPDLTVHLSSDANGYSLSFATTAGGVVLPAPMSGTWAGKGVSNSFSNVFAGISMRGRYTQMIVDKVVVQSGTVGEGEGEGEGEGVQGKAILSNVYPPFIDEGTTVILTGPAGTDHQWMKDDVDIVGATNRQLVFDPVTLLDQGTYKVEYNDGTKVIQVSDPFNLVVSPEGTVPVAGFLGLLALVATCSAAGLLLIRRRIA